MISFIRMAPEMCRNIHTKTPYSVEVDAWSLAMIALECAEGCVGENESTRAILSTITEPSPSLKEPSRWYRLFAYFLNLTFMNPISKVP